MKRVVRRTDQSGQVWQWTHDSRDLPRTVTRPAGAVGTYTYDLKRQLTRLTFGAGLGQRRDFEYDAAGNMTRALAFGAEDRAFTAACPWA